MKRHFILVATLAMFAAACLMLVACSKQDSTQITNPTPPIDITHMTLGEVHNTAAEIMIQMEGTIEERTMRTLQILYPQATDTEKEQMRTLFQEGDLAKSMSPELFQLLEEMKTSCANIPFGDYQALEAMHDELYIKHPDKLAMLDQATELNGASFAFWTEHYTTNANKRPEIGSLGTVIDTGVGLLIGSRLGPIVGGIFGAACSIAWMETAAECMGGCVSAPYYGPNPWCC